MDDNNDGEGSEPKIQGEAMDRPSIQNQIGTDYDYRMRFIDRIAA